MKEERCNQIIDEAYENYRNKRTTANKDNVREPHTLRNGMTGEISRPFTKEEFVDKCKADSDFSGKWGLKIEERELSLEERMQLWQNQQDGRGYFIMELLDNIPTKLIKLTYNNEINETYE